MSNNPTSLMFLFLLFFAVMSTLTTFYIFLRKDQVNRKQLAKSISLNEEIRAQLKQSNPNLQAAESLLNEQKQALSQIPCVAKPVVQKMMTAS